MRWLIWFVVCCLLIVTNQAIYDPKNFLNNYPTPHTNHNKLLGMILFYNLYQIDAMMLIFNEYVSMCEGGWDITLVLFTTVKYSKRLQNYLARKHYCARIDRAINITLSYHDPSIGTSLAAEHRKYITPILQDYDIFVYHESDIMFKYTHLMMYLQETKRLHQIRPEDGLREHVLGFQRYRRISRGNDMHINYTQQDLFENELFEEVPEFVPICIESFPYLYVKRNTHQAIWILTQQQILFLEEKCQFLNQSSASREYMSSFSIYQHGNRDQTNVYCGMSKLIPATYFLHFMIQHYWEHKHISWNQVWEFQESLSTNNKFQQLSCWHNIQQRDQDMLTRFEKE